MDTDTLTATIDAHLAAYGEADADRRARMVQRLWAVDGRLVDPPIDGRGHDGIGAVFGAVQSRYPGHTFRRSTGVDAHHGIARYGWEMIGADGAVALAGMDVAVLDEDGRLSRVAGFFGDLPPLG